MKSNSLQLFLGHPVYKIENLSCYCCTIFREKEVYEHLQEYIRRATGLAERKEHLIEVCVLFVQCMEV